MAGKYENRRILLWFIVILSYRFYCNKFQFIKSHTRVSTDDSHSFYISNSTVKLKDCLELLK